MELWKICNFFTEAAEFGQNFEISNVGYSVDKNWNVYRVILLNPWNR